MSRETIFKALRVAFLVVVIWTVVPVAMVELGFRWYEDRYLIDVHTIEEGEEVFPFQDLGYIEGLVPRRKLPGEFRILSLGDSFAASIVKEPYTYASVLERELSRKLDRKVTVVNLGIGGTSFPDYLHQLDLWGQILEFDAALVNVYAGNDFFDAGTEIVDETALRDLGDSPNPSKSARTIRTGPGTYVPRKYPLRILDWGHAIYFSQRSHETEAGDEYRRSPRIHSPERYLDLQSGALKSYLPDALAAAPEGIASLSPLLARLRDLENAGKRTLVMISPPHAMVSSEVQEETCRARGHSPALLRRDTPAQVVREVGSLVGYEVPTADILACLEQATSRGEELYYLRNTHWNVRGNELVGSTLAAHIATRWFGEGDEAPCVNEVREGSGGALKDAIHQALSVQESYLPLLRKLATIDSRQRKSLEALLEAEGLKASDSLRVTLETKRAVRGYLSLIGRREPAEDMNEPSLAVVFADGKIVSSAVDRGGSFRMRPSLDCLPNSSKRQLDVLIVSGKFWAWAAWRAPKPCQGRTQVP